MLQRETKFALERAPHQRVDAVGGDDQVLLPQLIQRRQLRAEPQIDAGLAGALLQEPQQLQPADRREADPVDHHPLAQMHDGDVAPPLHVRRDRRDGLGVVVAQELERLVGEHDAEAPGGVGGVLLDEAHLVAGMAPLPQRREVEPGRSAAHDCNAHGDLARWSGGLYPLVLAITSAPKRSMRATASAPVAPPRRRATCPTPAAERARHRQPCRPRCP